MNELSAAAYTPTPAHVRNTELIGPLLLAAGVFLLVYGVELFGFGLSIDEEAATFHGDYGSVWLQQGRWGMALVTFMLPNFESIPLVSTVLLGAGLIFATWRAFHDFRLSRGQAWLFAAVHVAFPIWLHIAQFNTLSAGFGFGIAAAAAGAGAVCTGSRMQRLAGIALLAFAASVYQTLAVYALLYIVFALHAALIAGGGMGSGTRSPVANGLVAVAGAAACWIVALLVYVAVQKVGLLLLDQNLTYVGSFVKTDRLVNAPGGVIADSAAYMRSVLGGRHPGYLRWGAGILFIAWLGLLPAWVLARDSGMRRQGRTAWLWTLAVFVIGVAIVAVPIVVSAATLPLRAQVAVPLLLAWAASRAGTALEQRAPALLWASLAYFCIVAASIGASLFYSDKVVRNADAQLLERLIPAIEEAAGTERTAGRIPVTLVGTRSFPFDGQLQRAEVFGTSLFEHDGGNIYRVELFMRIQGYDRVTPIWLSHRRDLLPSAHSMPSWPTRGSVKLVNGVVIVKLGPPSGTQLSSL